jgi:hypothetical protein
MFAALRSNAPGILSFAKSAARFMKKARAEESDEPELEETAVNTESEDDE